MKTITRIKTIFNENEKDAIKEYLTGDKALRETSRALNCSHEQVRLLMGKIFVQGIQEGWITMDFDRF